MSHFPTCDHGFLMGRCPSPGCKGYQGDRRGRPETGLMAFGEDWPGIFIRCDAALGYADDLKRGRGADLIKLLSSCRHRDQWPEVQQLKQWEDCQED